MLIYLSTLVKLGLWNVLYVMWYRFSLKSGIRKIWFPTRQLPADQDYYRASEKRTDYPEGWKQSLVKDANKLLSGELRYFACHWKKTGNPPDWFLNPFSELHHPYPKLHWTKLADFNEQVGDIKCIWEASRLEWVITLARAYGVTGERKYLRQLNSWLKDWAIKNPLNIGPNWKCGQEASIRLFNLTNAAIILQQHEQPQQTLTDLVYYHLLRINSNIRYAIAQDNNHGTSEAAGLFIGGVWLMIVNQSRYSKAPRFAKKGRKWLENRVAKLVTNDGSFSQHSVNYHRLMLDVLSFVEFWGKQTYQKPFSLLYYKRLRAATNWLYIFTENKSGNAPNLGANDGGLLNHLHSCTYRDFRPSIQLAGLLFTNKIIIEPGKWDEPLFWLNLQGSSMDIHEPDMKSIVVPSGYVKLQSKTSWAILRFPYFRFRPSHNDVFHFDLWFDGKNILCDAGTYSYNAPRDEKNIDLKSVQHHNTVSFDNHEQMPQLSRFLMGKWIKPKFIGEIETKLSGEFSWQGAYQDHHRNHHRRRIRVSEDTWIIEDTLSGDFMKAVIGFNINTPTCILNNNVLLMPIGTISTMEGTKCFLTETIISDHYLQKQRIQRLNIPITQSGTYTTIIKLQLK
jgi:hypothetical protein